MEATLRIIEAWRSDACALASRFSLPDETTNPVTARVLADLGITTISWSDFDPGARWAKAYLKAHSAASRSCDLPGEVGFRLSQLITATKEADGWAAIAGFDAALDAIFAARGAEGQLSPSVRNAARQPFAKAVLEVEQHREHQRQRQRAALLAASQAVGEGHPATIHPASAPNTYVARQGDLTVGQLIAKARAEKIEEQVGNGKPREHAEAYVRKNYGPIFSGLEELFGAERPAQAKPTWPSPSPPP